MTLPAPDAVPPICVPETAVLPVTTMPGTLNALGTNPVGALVPDTPVPIRLPCTTMSRLAICTLAIVALAAMTLPAPGALPPMTAPRPLVKTP